MAIAISTAKDSDLTQLVTDALDASGLREIGYGFLLDLQTMRYGECRSDVDIYPASVIKVPVMAEAFHQYAEEIVNPNDSVIVTQANQTSTWGVSPFESGARTTVAALVERMITHSDNVATNQLMDVLRRERVTAYMRELGLSTFLLGRKLSGSEPLIHDPEMVGRNRLPPNEIGALLTLIASDRLPGSAEQRAIMERCIHADKFVPGLHPKDRLMHKTGETSTESHDAGILETPEGRRYVVVLYTAPEPKPDESDADHVNPQIARWMREVRSRL